MSADNSSPPGAADFRFATKATTLERLGPHLTQARLCEQIIVSAANWQNRRDEMVNHIVTRFPGSPIAVRSSAACEDTWDSSHAGDRLVLRDNTLVVVCGDHGEELGDHGDINHHFRFYSHNVRVPLIFYHPAIDGQRIDGLMTLLDVAPIRRT